MNMNYQKVWDENLIYGWRADISKKDLALRFIDTCNNELFKSVINSTGKMLEVVEYISSLKLKRCRDNTGKNKEPEFSLRRNVPLRAFVAERSDHLSKCLWSEKNKTEDILEAIDRFKWVRVSGGTSNEKRNRNNEKRCTKVIKARSLTKKHDWGTVK